MFSMDHRDSYRTVSRSVFFLWLDVQCLVEAVKIPWIYHKVNPTEFDWTTGTWNRSNSVGPHTMPHDNYIHAYSDFALFLNVSQPWLNISVASRWTSSSHKAIFIIAIARWVEQNLTKKWTCWDFVIKILKGLEGPTKKKNSEFSSWLSSQRFP